MRIVWRPGAVQDVDELWRFIAADSVAAGQRVVLAVEEAVERAASMPNLGRVGRVAGTRELVAPQTPYVVVYAETVEELMILAVLHSERTGRDGFAD